MMTLQQEINELKRMYYQVCLATERARFKAEQLKALGQPRADKE